MFKSTWKEDCMLWLFKTFIQTFHGFGIIFFNNLQSSQRLVRRPFQGLYQIVQVVFTPDNASFSWMLHLKLPIKCWYLVMSPLNLGRLIFGSLTLPNDLVFGDSLIPLQNFDRRCVIDIGFLWYMRWCSDEVVGCWYWLHSIHSKFVGSLYPFVD